MDTTDGRLTRWLLCSISILVLSFSSASSNAAPADGVVFWNPADRDPDILLSNGNMDIGVPSTAADYIGVRSNRPINPGEGIYYLELSTSISTGNFMGFGIATADAALQGLGVDETAVLTIVGQNDVPAIGMIVDYRGEFPIVYFFRDLGAGTELVSTESMRDFHGPVYLYLSTRRNNLSSESQPLFRLNYGTVEAFQLDPAAAVAELSFDVIDELDYGWPIDDQRPQVTIASGNRVTAEGGNLLFSAFANDAESGDITASVNWFLDDVPVGTGGGLFISPSAGTHIVRAEVLDSVGQRAFDSVRAEVLSNEALDSDYDGIPYYVEIENGTNPGARDSDFDGLSDSEETAQGTDPLSSDTDGDLMPDGYEVAHGLDPLTDDAAADLDGDTFDNATEFFSDRSASDPNDFPGHGIVLLNAADANTNIVLQPGALSFSVTESSGLGAVRSDVSIAQGTGWHYYEGYRHADVGNFGFGVATAAASLTAAAGTDAQSVGVGANGDITFDGAVVMTLTSPEDIDEYGIAVDYSGTNPVVFVLARPAGGVYEVSSPITMTGITADLHIFAYGESQSGVVQQSINAGQNKRDFPFAYSARYILYRAGQTSAEFMREGWGSAYVYQPQSTIALEDTVTFVREGVTSPRVTMSRDGTEFGWTVPGERVALRANQSMIGEFRYWEAQFTGPVGAATGYGLISPFGIITPYCCVGTELTGAPPSLILNSSNIVWRNLVYQNAFTGNNNFFGFAVDYRGTRPTVYVIHDSNVVHTALLDDFIAPITPMMHGGATDVGPVPVTHANFGQEPFRNDARQALIDAGVNVTQFVPGWGVYQQERNLADGPLTEPVIDWTGATAGLTGQPLNITAVATDAEDGDLTAFILWNNDQTADLGAGGTYDFIPPTSGIYRVMARVTDSSGLEYAATVDVPVTDTDTTSPVISVPPPLVIDLTSGSSLPATDAQIAGFLAAATARDDVEGALSVTNDAPAQFAIGTTIVNFETSDSSGNVGTALSSVTINDAGAPTVTAPADLEVDLNSGTEVSAGDPAIAAFLGNASGDDDVDGSVSVTHDAPAQFGLGATVVTFSATDAAGNTGTATATVTVSDTGAPAVTAPADISLDLPSGNSIPDSDPAIAAFLSAASASDDVDGTVAVTNDAPASFATGITSVTFSATDAAGNTGTATATVTVNDTGAPVISVPANIALDLDSGSSIPAGNATIAAFLSGASATDDVDGAPAITHDAPADFAVGVTTVTFTATDASGNTDSAAATVTITDTGAPSVTAPADLTIDLATGSTLPASDSAIAAFLAAASASDDVDGSLTVANDAPADFPIGATVVTFSATDAAGNSDSATATVTLTDTGAPTVTAPADLPLDLNSGSEIPVTDPAIAAFLSGASASDDVDGTIAVTNDAPANFPVGATVVTFSATDAAGNADSATATVTITDTGAPSVTAPADLEVDLAVGATLPASDSAIAAFLAAASASDDVDGSLSVTHDAPADFPVGVTTVTFSAIDASGNTASASATVTVSDTGAPTMTAPTDLAIDLAAGSTVPVGDDAIANFLAAATASDDVDPAPAITHDAPAQFPIGATIVTFTATDAAGNTDSATATVTVSDTGEPTVTAPADLALSLDSGSSIPATDTAIADFLAAASASDDVDGSLSVTNDAPTEFLAGATVVTFSATDGAGNTSSATATVSISDNGAPALTVPTDLTINLPSGANVPISDPAIEAFLTAASATDDVEGPRPVTSDAPAQFLPGTTVVTFTTADTVGNTATATSNVTVVDTGVPSLNLPEDLVVSLNSGNETLATEEPIAGFLAAASASDDVDGDNVSGNVTLTHNAPATFQAATTTVVNFTATDTAGNSVSEARNITVNDTGAPSLSVPTDIIIEVDTGSSLPATDPTIAAFLAAASASDNVDSDPAIEHDAPATFPIGITTVTFTATDAAGNETSAASSVVLSDTGAPALIVPTDLVIDLTAGNAVAIDDPAIAAFIAAATALDVVDGALPATNDAPASFPIGTTLVTFSVTDSADNTATDTANVTVNDAGTPAVSAPADIVIGLASGATASAADPAITAFLAGAAANDDVDGPLGVSHDAPSDFPVGVTTVTFNATDAAGNTGAASATVTVTDTGLPVVTAPADLAISITLGSSLSASDPAIAGFLAAASAADDVDGALAVTHDAPANLPVGITTVTFSAIDAAGNTGAATADIVINDGGAPAVTAPSDVVINITSGSGVSNSDPAITAFLAGATAVDSVEGTLALTDDAPATFPVGVTTVTFSATDSIGNTSTATASVTVVDAGVPLVTPPAGITINIIDGSDIPATDPTIAAFLSSAGASDDVDGPLAVLNDAPAAFAPGVTTVTFSATDAAGNTASATSSVTINVTNVAPSAAITIEQGGELVTTVTRDGGPVTLSVVVTDANVIDSHAYDWSGTDAALVPLSGTNSLTFVFDPAAVGQGVYSLSVVVTDNGNAPLAGAASSLVRVIDSLPALSSTEDSDGDGTMDADEGAGDSDGDRIPDYLDPDSNGAEQLSAGDNGALIETSPGLTLRLGRTAFSIDAADSVLTIEEVEAWATAIAGGVASGMDDDYLYPAGIFDVEVTNLAVGGTATITISLADAIGANATLREFVMASGWSRFLTDVDNLVQSAPGSLGSCPPTGSTEYTDGLTEGNFCIQLSITDGGANDADGVADGTIRILTGPATYIGPDPNLQVSNTVLGASVFRANDGEQVVLDFNVASDSDDAELHELTIGATGELNEAANVSAVGLYYDANDDGIADASEMLTVGSYSADDGQVTFTLASPQGLSNGDNRFLVTYNF